MVMKALAMAATGRPMPSRVDFDVAIGRAPRLIAPGTWFAVAILAAGLLVPTCCLDGTHAHGFGLDGFGAICFART
jgi:hypothetical protein